MTDRETALEAFFDAGRAQPPSPSEDLLARIEADALAEIEGRAPKSAPRKSGALQDIMAVLGGWRTGAGLGTAAVAGLMMGLLLPDTFAGFGSVLTGEIAFDETTLAPSYGLAWLDGIEG